MARPWTPPDTDPPTKSTRYSLDYGTAHLHNLPQYPYTPDSSRILRRTAERDISPIPWDTDSSQDSSPVQNALSSCIAHFENLLQTRQPDEDQMEYIVGQFEAMATYLSAPDAQSRGTDEHLFAEFDGTMQTAGEEHGGLNKKYVASVERYIESVRGHVSDLKMRLDEVKMLNSIQLDVIQDLRSQMKTVKVDMHSSLGMAGAEEAEEYSLPQHEYQEQPFGSESTATLVNPSLPSSQILDPPDQVPATKPNPQDRHVTFDTSDSSPPRRRLITIIHKSQQRSFWSSFAEALDSFGEMIFES